MLEETILTKDENEKYIKENAAADTSAIGMPTNTDASNVVPFTSESAAADPQLIESVLKTSAETPKPLHEQETVTPASAPVLKSPAADTGTPTRAPADTDGESPFSEKTSELFGKASEFAGKTIQKAASHIKSDERDDFPEDDAPSKRQFHFRKDDKEFFRDKWILSRISDEQLMEYLTLEQRRNELQQQAKDVKEKRIFKAFQITAALAAVVAVIYLLKDNPTILVNILYIAGILTAFWFWKNPRDK